MRAVDRRLLSAGGIARRAIVLSVGTGTLNGVLAIAQAALLAWIIAAVLEPDAGVVRLEPPLVALLAVVVARAVLAWIAEVGAQRISGRVKADLRGQLLARAVSLGPRWASDTSSAEVSLLATRGLDALDGWYARVLPQVALAAIVPVAVVVCLVLIDPVAGLTVGLTVPLIPVFMVLVGRFSAAHRDRRWATLSILGRRFLDVVAGLPTLRTFGRTDGQVTALRGATDAWRSATMATLRIAFLSALVLELLATLSVALVAVGVGVRLDGGTMTLATGLFAIILAPEAYLPLRRLGAEFHAGEEGLASARAAFAIIDAPPSTGAGDRRLAGRPIAIAVEGVSVIQPGRDLEAPAGATFRAEAGAVLAITGSNGAGKSTLLSVLLRLVEPTGGRVLIEQADGAVTDLRELEPDAWRRQVAWVPQVPYLFEGTVAENVRLGAPHLSDAAVAGALARAGLGGLDADRVVGERGVGLSSGQRRRLGLARAFARAAPVLLLDEPTAGLDAPTEVDILGAVRAAAGEGAIVIIVAHRPEAAAFADHRASLRWRFVLPATDRTVREPSGRTPLPEPAVSP